MNLISYHPKLKNNAVEIEEFLDSLGLNDLNVMVGGDGTLLAYFDKEKINVLISSSTSAGYYCTARLNNYKEKPPTPDLVSCPIKNL